MSVYYILLSHITIWWHSGRLIYYMIGQASCLMAAISLNHWPSSCTCGVCSVLWCLNLLLPINLQVYPYNGRSPKLVHFGDMEVPSDFRTSYLHHIAASHLSMLRRFAFIPLFMLGQRSPDATPEETEFLRLSCLKFWLALWSFRFVFHFAHGFCFVCLCVCFWVEQTHQLSHPNSLNPNKIGHCSKIPPAFWILTANAVLGFGWWTGGVRGISAISLWVVGM